MAQKPTEVYTYDSDLEKAIMKQEQVLCLDEKSYMTALWVAMQLCSRGKSPKAKVIPVYKQAVA